MLSIETFSHPQTELHLFDDERKERVVVTFPGTGPLCPFEIMAARRLYTEQGTAALLRIYGENHVTVRSL